MQVGSFPDTSDGLQSLIGEILQAAKSKDAEKEAALIHSLLIPEDSTWFTDVYGPGFGASLAAAYRQVRPNLELQIRTLYEGNVKRGLMTPKILSYTDPANSDAPIDRFLNCMNQIVPLYATAFQGNRPSIVVSMGRSGPIAGDLAGYFVYDRGSFRFIPSEILIKLPEERPIRIQLDWSVMQSKIISQVPIHIPPESTHRNFSGEVTVEVVLDVDGNVTEAKVVDGDPILANALLEAMKQWKFAPTKLDGDPVEVDFQFHMRFGLGRQN